MPPAGKTFLQRAAVAYNGTMVHEPSAHYRMLAARIKEMAQTFLYKGKDALLALEENGLQIIPFNFYSPIPSVSELEKGWERTTAFPFLEPKLYDNQAMVDFLKAKLFPFAHEFDPPAQGSEDPTVYSWDKPNFGASDAMALYCFLRFAKPKRVVEIGGGSSTLVIRQALKANGFGELWEIEPFPSPFLTTLDVITQFFQSPVQNVPMAVFDSLEANDILFIDSTHTVKESSDCTYLYLKVLPRLKKGVLIHSHDIFLPEPMPLAWALQHQVYWNEQYLLQALLLGGGFVILYGSHYHELFNPDLLTQFMSGKAPAGGGSFWYQRV